MGETLQSLSKDLLHWDFLPTRSRPPSQDKRFCGSLYPSPRSTALHFPVSIDPSVSTGLVPRKTRNFLLTLVGRTGPPLSVGSVSFAVPDSGSPVAWSSNRAFDVEGRPFLPSRPRHDPLVTLPEVPPEVNPVENRTCPSVPAKVRPSTPHTLCRSSYVRHPFSVTPPPTPTPQPLLSGLIPLFSDTPPELTHTTPPFPGLTGVKNEPTTHPYPSPPYPVRTFSLLPV